MNTSSSPFSTAALWVAARFWQTISKEFHTMKRSLVGALLALTMACGGTAVFAQQDNMSQGAQSAPPAHHMMSPDQRLQHMTQMLNLTSDQQQKIKPILENEQTQMQALHQDSSMSQQDRRAKMQQMHESTREQINAILTSEQQQKWQSMQNRHMEHMHGGMGQGQPQTGAPPAPPPQ